MSGYHLSGVQCYHKFVLNEAQPPFMSPWA